MSIKTKNNFKKNIVNIFGAFGYLVCSLQWLWAVMLNFSLIKAILMFISPGFDNQVVKSSLDFDLSLNPFFMTIAAVITVAMVVLTIYVLIKMPSTIAKNSKKAVHETADKVAPLILKIQHKKVTKKNYIKLTPRIILAVKGILIIAPVLLTFTPPSIDNRMIDYSIAVYVSLWLAGISVILFIIQYFIARLFLVKRQDVW